MLERKEIESPMIERLNFLNQLGGPQKELSHQARNQLHSLSLSYQTLLLQSQLGLPLDESLMQVAEDQWQQLLTDLSAAEGSG